MECLPGVGFEPTRISPTRLKRVSLGHSDILVFYHYHDKKPGFDKIHLQRVGFEPTRIAPPRPQAALFR